MADKKAKKEGTKATAEALSVSFAMEKETKNTVRYAEVVPEGEYPQVGTLYLQKPAASSLGNPKGVEVTIKPA